MMQTQCGVPGIDYGWRSKIRFKDNWRFRFLSEVMSVPNIKLEYNNQEMNNKELYRGSIEAWILSTIIQDIYLHYDPFYQK